MEQWIIQDIPFNVLRKPVKGLRITLRPPLGQPQVTVPLFMPKKTVQLFLEQKIPWVKKHQSRIQQLTREPEKTYTQGEQHLLFGERLTLELQETTGRSRAVRDGEKLILYLGAHATLEQRAKILNQFYRQALKERVPGLIQTYEQKMGVQVQDWGIKAMKTRWGTCNPRAKRIWVNLELVKMEPRFLEYLVVHEMVHLLEPSHNSRFYQLMTQFYPDWKAVREGMKGWGRLDLRSRLLPET